MRSAFRMSRPPRAASFAYTGPYCYLLTFCTHRRQPVFLNVEVVAATRDQVRLVASANQFAILAYCFMPDHVHLLVQGMADYSDLRQFVRIAKQRAAHRYAQTVGKQLWQEGYYDRILRKQDDVWVSARYVWENPVRAGLVSAASDYTYSGSDAWTVSDILSSRS